MYDLGGGTAIYDDSPLQRRFRDAHTATAHFQVNEASRELPGRILLGQPTDATCDAVSLVNAQCRLAARPVGLPQPSDWDYVEEPAPEPGTGSFGCRSSTSRWTRRCARG